MMLALQAERFESIPKQYFKTIMAPLCFGDKNRGLQVGLSIGLIHAEILDALDWEEDSGRSAIFGQVIIHYITIFVRSNFTVHYRDMNFNTVLTISGSHGSCGKVFKEHLHVCSMEADTGHFCITSYHMT